MQPMLAMLVQTYKVSFLSYISGLKQSVYDTFCTYFDSESLTAPNTYMHIADLFRNVLQRKWVTSI